MIVNQSEFVQRDDQTERSVVLRLSTKTPHAPEVLLIHGTTTVLDLKRDSTESDGDYEINLWFCVCSGNQEMSSPEMPVR